MAAADTLPPGCVGIMLCSKVVVKTKWASYTFEWKETESGVDHNPHPNMQSVPNSNA